MSKISLADISSEKLVRLAKKYGFIIKQGKRHIKVETIDGKFITIIPRKSHLKKFTTKGILEKFNEYK